MIYRTQKIILTSQNISNRCRSVSLVHTSKLDFLCNSFLHPHRLSTNSTTNSNQL